MAGKKETRSSKTDHVLHLLSGMIPEPEETPSEQTAPPAAPPAPYSPEVPQHRGAPILEVAQTNHDALAESIRQALEENLEQELKTPPEVSTPPEKPAPKPAPSMEPSLQETSGNAPVSKVEDSPEPEPVPEEVSQPGIRELPDGSVWMDVMPILVEEQLDHYLKIFHLCECSRCRADVQALALNGLPTKYVVLDKEKANSMLGFYRYRFGTSVSIELTKACETVKKHPRHT